MVKIVYWSLLPKIGSFLVKGSKQCLNVGAGIICGAAQAVGALDIDLAADIIPVIINEFPPVLNDATTPPKNITHFPAKKSSGSMHFLPNQISLK